MENISLLKRKVHPKKKKERKKRPTLPCNVFTFAVLYNVVVQIVIEDFSPVLDISRSV